MYKLLKERLEEDYKNKKYNDFQVMSNNGNIPKKINANTINKYIKHINFDENITLENTINEICLNFNDYLSDNLKYITNWSYSFYVYILFLAYPISSYPNKPDSVYNYIKDFLSKNSEEKFKYILLPLRFSMHYLSDESYNINYKDNKLKEYQSKNVTTLIISNENDIAKDFDFDVNRINNSNSLENDNVYVIPMVNISISDLTRFLYSDSYDIFKKNNGDIMVGIDYNNPKNNIKYKRNIKYNPELLKTLPIGDDDIKDDYLDDIIRITHIDNTLKIKYNEILCDKLKKKISNINKSIDNRRKTILKFSKEYGVDFTYKNFYSKYKKLIGKLEADKNSNIISEYEYEEKLKILNEVNKTLEKIKYLIDLLNKTQSLLKEIQDVPKSLYISYETPYYKNKQEFEHYERDKNIEVMYVDNFNVKQKNGKIFDVSINDKGRIVIKNIIEKYIKNFKCTFSNEIYGLVEKRNIENIFSTNNDFMIISSFSLILD